jgi:MFS family permease
VSRATDKLSRNIVILSWVSFFQDAATEMLFPVLPLFITVVLGAPVAVVGLVEGLADGISSLMKGVSGRLADRYPRRPLVFAGYGIASLAKAAIAVAMTWPFVLFCRVLDRIGKGLRTAPRDALIEADTTQANRGRAFGFHRAMDSFGAVVGPIIGLVLFEALHRSLRPLFLVGVIPALISMAFIWFVKEAPRKATAATTRMRWDFSRQYWTVLILLTAFNLVNFSVGLIIVKVKELGIDTVEIFLIYALYNLSYAMLSYPAGRLSDRMPRRLIFAAGMLVFAASFIGFAFAKAELWAWLLFALFGAFMALTDGVGTAWVADLAPRDRVGSALGVYYASSGFATIIAGLWAGAFWAGTGFVPFLVAGSTAAALAAALLLLHI